jgi:hypothetical protein
VASANGAINRRVMRLGGAVPACCSSLASVLPLTREAEEEPIASKVGNRRIEVIRNSRRIFLFACLLVALAGPLPARAQDWERLPDGRVVIEIEGVRLGLPTEEPHVDDIGFYIRPLGSSSGELKLRRIIASPEKARQTFASADDISLRIPFIADRPGLLLGRFDRNDLPTVSFSFSVGPRTERLCQSLAGQHAEYRRKISAGAVPEDRYGWWEFIDVRSPRTWTYFRASPLPRLPPEMEAVQCNGLGWCATTACLGQRLGFSYSFNGRVFDRSTWTNLMEKAAAVMDFVLIARNRSSNP